MVPSHPVRTLQFVMQQLQSGEMRPSTASSSTLADDVSSKVILGAKMRVVVLSC